MIFTKKTAEFLKDAKPGTYELPGDLRLIIHDDGTIEVQEMCYNGFLMYFATTKCFPDYDTFVQQTVHMNDYYPGESWERVGDVGMSPVI